MKLFHVLPVMLIVILLAVSAFALEETRIKDVFPFFPSLMTTSTGQIVKSDAFESASICSGCHTDIYNQWKGSMHSNAFVDPVFQALWMMGEKELKGSVRNLCAGCHTAIGTVAQEVKVEGDKFVASDVAMEGVSCDMCHTISDTRMLQTPTGLPQNGSFVIAPGEVKRGPYKDSVSPYHQTAYSDLHTKSEFCGSCHNVFHPVSNFHVENTYTEWKFSVYAQKGIQCQDCHMVPVDVAVKTAKDMKKPDTLPGQPCITGPKRSYMYTHEFIGGNAVLTKLLGAEKHSHLAVQRLTHAAGLEAKFDDIGKGNMGELHVKVINEAAGHNLPTSLTEVREMWLDVTITDDKGGVVLRSGALDAEGNVDEKAEMFRAHAVDEHGHHTVKPWEIARFEYNNTIPPKGSKKTKYSFLVPPDVKKIIADVKLNYRSYPQAVANLLLGKNAPVIPVVLMKQKKIEISVK